MQKAQALAAIRASFDRGTNTPCTWTSDRDAYIAEQSASLFSYAIEPIQVSIQGEAFSYDIKNQLSQSTVFAIANKDENWLLYSPDLGSFSLAFGKSTSNLKVLGFASDDALSEWLG